MKELLVLSLTALGVASCGEDAGTRSAPDPRGQADVSVDTDDEIPWPTTLPARLCFGLLDLSSDCLEDQILEHTITEGVVEISFAFEVPPDEYVWCDGKSFEVVPKISGSFQFPESAELPYEASTGSITCQNCYRGEVCNAPGGGCQGGACSFVWGGGEPIAKIYTYEPASYGVEAKIDTRAMIPDESCDDAAACGAVPETAPLKVSLQLSLQGADTN